MLVDFIIVKKVSIYNGWKNVLQLKKDSTKKK